MLEIKNIYASLAENDKNILNWVNLKVWKWELHIILWPNWSWKSTLWKVLLSHFNFKKKSWEIIFEWEEIWKLETFERAKKWLFLSHQHPVAIDWISWFEIMRASQKEIWEHISLFKFKKIVKNNFTNLWLKEEFLEREFNKWASWGEQKKMEIAQMQSIWAKFAFLDEIDSWLDFDALKLIWKWINEFLENWEKSIILVTHSKEILNYLNPTFFHIFCHWKILKTWWREILEELEEKWYAWIISDECEVCEKKEVCSEKK